MYKLTVIAGPNRGTSYAMNEGETTLGRQNGNAIVLQSSKVSKRHCSLVVSNGEIVLRDQGSSNGTFVNGSLTKARKVKPGDRISVGEFVFEVTAPVKRAARSAPAVAGFGNVLQFPVPGGASRPPGVGTSIDMNSAGGTSAPAGPPKDLKGKAIWIFENHVMPIFYGMLLKNEWKVICIGLFAAFVFGNLGLSVYPLMESSRATIVQETGKRASFMAKQIAERNAPFLAARTETRSEIGASLENADGVRVSLLTDLDSRIIAPSSKINQYLTSGAEATAAVRARDAFRSGRETGFVIEADSETIVAIEPVKILNPAAGKNVTVGMSIVSIDTSLATPDMGQMGMIYSETLILTGILGALVLLILYRLTLRPFQVLNEDMDKVLKGEMPQVTNEYKFEEMGPLWDIINSALQRVPKSGSSEGGLDLGGGGGSSPEEYAGPLRMLGGVSKFGLVLCDSSRKIVYLNPMFEEISGIRADGAVGQDFGGVARDQSMGAFVNDLFDRAPAGGDGVSEDYDFSGIGYKVHASAFGTPGGTARCYVLAAVRSE